MERRKQHTENLRQQLERTRSTYLMMRETGYDKQDRVRLKFAYRPTAEADAAKLVDHLRDKTSCKVDLQEIEGGWVVFGYTPPRKLSAASLGRWVHWMCMVGYRHDCVFDGWGARVSSS